MLALTTKTTTFPLPLSVESRWNIVKTILELQERTSYPAEAVCPFLVDGLKFSKVVDKTVHATLRTDGAKEAFSARLLDDLKRLCRTYMGMTDVVLETQKPLKTGIFDPEYRSGRKDDLPRADVKTRKSEAWRTASVRSKKDDDEDDLFDDVDSTFDSNVPDANMPLKMAVLDTVAAHYEMEPESIRGKTVPLPDGSRQKAMAARKEAMGLSVQMLSRNNVLPFSEVAEFYQRTTDEVMRAYKAVMGGLRTSRTDPDGRPNVTPFMKKMRDFKQAVTAKLEPVMAEVA